MHKQQPANTTIKVNDSVEGETIEQKIERVTQNNEPITDGADRVYTERKDGVRPEYNIRTDRFDIAVDAMGEVSKSHLTKRQQAIEEMRKKKGGEITTEVKTGEITITT